MLRGWGTQRAHTSDAVRYRVRGGPDLRVARQYELHGRREVLHGQLGEQARQLVLRTQPPRVKVRHMAISTHGHVSLVAFRGTAWTRQEVQSYQARHPAYVLLRSPTHLRAPLLPSPKPQRSPNIWPSPQARCPVIQYSVYVGFSFLVRLLEPKSSVLEPKKQRVACPLGQQ